MDSVRLVPRRVWRRTGDPEFPHKIEPIAQRVLTPGEIISFTPDAIHHVEAVSREPRVTFQLYGDTQPRSRLRSMRLPRRS